MAWETSAPLYDAMAPDFDLTFERPGHRRAYDLLAGEFIAGLLPAPPALIVDVGCGTGRWPARWLDQGYRVIGIEHSPGMIAVLRQQVTQPGFTLIEAGMDEAHVAPGSVDAVIAMGSLQYVRDPAASLRRLASWVGPGGLVVAQVDSCMGLVLDLLRRGQTEEALLRLQTRRGEMRHQGNSAPLHLYDRETLRRDFVAAGLDAIDCRGLAIGVSALGRDGCASAMAADAETYLALERRLAADPAMADAGLHLIMSGRRPARPSGTI